MVNAQRSATELWQLEVGQNTWRCALDADDRGYRVDIMKEGNVVASRRFADEMLATWWAALERAELLG